MKHVAAGSDFVGKHQLRRQALQPPHQLVQVVLERPDLTNEVRWLDRAAHGVGDADRLFVNIQTDEKRSRLGHG